MYDTSIISQGDIFLHVGVSAVMTLFFLLFFRRAPKRQAVMLTFILVMGVGFGKEIYDACFSVHLGGNFSIKDLVSNYAGLTLGLRVIS